MTRSSAGGSAAAGGVGHEGWCLAWVAAHMLVEASLPAWASGHRVVAVGGQTPRAVDDIGFITDRGGWGMVQAKKGLKNLRKGNTSALAEALDQLVAVEALGVPEDPPSERFRALDPDVDAVLVLSDHTAFNTINEVLAPMTDRLRDLPLTWPIDDVPRNQDEKKAFALLRGHLERLWKTRHGTDLGEADLRRLGKVLSVKALQLGDGGGDRYAIENLLIRVAPHPDDVPAIWRILGQEAQRLADERTFLDRASLVDRLESEGIVLRPLARLRPDIDRLRQITVANLAVMGRNITITAPEGPVEVSRGVSALIAGADGNVAITGAPGAGKTVVLHGLAVAASELGTDVVMLRPNDLRASRGQVRHDLNLVHDLEEILKGWPGATPGLLLVDGLDQSFDTPAYAWLPGLANALAATRWSVVATIRSFDLKHGPPWQNMFAGEPVDQETAGAGLDHVRHVTVTDLTAEELRSLRLASPRLSALIDTADNRLRKLLANPFNIDLAARLLHSNAAADLAVMHSRADLLHSYWQHRVGDLALRRTLRAVVGLMVSGGRQAVNPVELPAEASSDSLVALQHEGVLRDLPTSPGHGSALVEFSHPVLFDYIVAMFALGDNARPESLADRLDEEPNLALRLRPSVEYRLATIWRDATDRETFWRLSLRLASRRAGHLLAAAAAARVAANEMRTAGDWRFLADACAGISGDDYDRWEPADAHGLAFLLASTFSRAPAAEEADAAFAEFVDWLARRAQEVDDVDLALLAAQLPDRRFSGELADAGSEPAARLTSAIVSCMAVALTDLADSRRAQLATAAVRTLAGAAVVDPTRAAPSIRGLCTADALRALGTRHMHALVDKIAEIAGRDPDLAITVGVAAFEYAEGRDEQIPLYQSAIFGMTTNRRDELDSIRYAVGQKFKELADVSATAATTFLLRALKATDSDDRWPERGGFAVPPHPRLGDTLRYTAGHGVLLTMTNTLIERLAQLGRDAGDSRNGGPAPQQLADIVNQILALLRHDEAWQRLLRRAATDESSGLALALTPTLLVPNLFAYPSTWIAAGHLAHRISPLVSEDEHAQLETAIWQLVDAGRIPGDDDQRAEERLTLRRDTILRCLSFEHLVDPRSRQRLRETDDDAEDLVLPDVDEAHIDGVGEMVWEADPPDLDSPDGLQQQISASGEQLRSDDESVRARGRENLIDLWHHFAEISRGADAARTGFVDVSMEDVRLQAAQLLARESQASPGSQLGIDVYDTLRAHLPDPHPAAADRSNQRSWSGRLPSWSSSPSNNAIEGLAVLITRSDWRSSHGDELARLLSPFLESADPVRRFLVSRALPGLYPDRDELFHQLVARLLAEPDEHIAADLLARISWFRPSRAHEIDAVLRQLQSRPEWGCATAQPHADRQPDRDSRWEAAVNVLTVLAVMDATPYATSIVEAWLGSPLDHPDRAVLALARLRELLNPADNALQPAQDRAFQLLSLTMSRLREAWATPEEADEPTETRRERLGRIVKLADCVGQQVYFSSGAHDMSEGKEPAQPRGDLRQFSTLALPLLEQLVEIDYPAVTHRVVQTADHLRLTQPRRALLIAARAISEDAAYAREPLALDAVLDLLRRYLTEHRNLVLNDNDCMDAIRKMLEAHVRLGWDKAIELSEKLEDYFD